MSLISYEVTASPTAVFVFNEIGGGHREGVCRPHHLGAPCAQERGQTTQKEKAEQCQHAGGGCLAHGSAFPASQPHRLGSLLSQARSTAGRRCCSDRQEVGHA